MKNFSFVLGPHFSEVAYSKHPVGFVPLKNFLRIPRHLKGQPPVPSERLAANTSQRVGAKGTAGEGWPETACFPAWRGWPYPLHASDRRHACAG